MAYYAKKIGKMDKEEATHLKDSTMGENFLTFIEVKCGSEHGIAIIVPSESDTHYSYVGIDFTKPYDATVWLHQLKPTDKVKCPQIWHPIKTTCQ